MKDQWPMTITREQFAAELTRFLNWLEDRDMALTREPTRVVAEEWLQERQETPAAEPDWHSCP